MPCETSGHNRLRVGDDTHSSFNCLESTSPQVACPAPKGDVVVSDYDSVSSDWIGLPTTPLDVPSGVGGELQHMYGEKPVDNVNLAYSSITCLDECTDGTLPYDFNAYSMYNEYEFVANSPMYTDTSDIDFDDDVYAESAPAGNANNNVDVYGLLCYSSRNHPMEVDYNVCCVQMPTCVKMYDPFDTGWLHNLFNTDYYVHSRFDTTFQQCDGPCHHLVGGIESQMNLCAVYREAYLHPVGVDVDAEFILQGVRDGFKIVNDDIDTSYQRNNYNSIKSDRFRSQMDKTVVDEVAEGKLSVSNSIPTCVHSLGAVPKKNGKLRPIVDMRQPMGYSVNTFMSDVTERFHYINVDDVCRILPPNGYLAVLDISSAYRSLSVRPDQAQYQGIMWPDGEGHDVFYKDNRLAFGAKCSPYIFQMFTDFVVRCMRRRGFYATFGYLDDFIVLGDTREECMLALNVLYMLLRQLGFHLAYEKMVMPAQCVTYLGIQIDSVSMELSLPPGKLTSMSELVSTFCNRDKATKKELQSLAGHLSHASTVVKGGRTFSRRVINLIKCLPDGGREVPLPPWFQDDLMWWKSFMCVFNGRAAIIVNNPTVHVATDSSMSGFGATCNESDFLVGSWAGVFWNQSDFQFSPSHLSVPPGELDSVKDPDINLLELWPVVASASKWVHLWKNQTVLLESDNTQVVRAINTGRSTSIRTMCWLRELFWLSFIFNFKICCVYINTHSNRVPDFLSRITDPRVKGKMAPPELLFMC